MTVQKLSTELCLALQNSDGPFNVVITFKWDLTGLIKVEYQNLKKEGLETLSKLEFVESIDINKRIADRRWRER